MGAPTEVDGGRPRHLLPEDRKTVAPEAQRSGEEEIRFSSSSRTGKRVRFNVVRSVSWWSSHAGGASCHTHSVVCVR